MATLEQAEALLGRFIGYQVHEHDDHCGSSPAHILRGLDLERSDVAGNSLYLAVSTPEDPDELERWGGVLDVLTIVDRGHEADIHMNVGGIHWYIREAG